MRTRQSEHLFDFYRNASRLSRAMTACADRELPEGMTMSRFELLDLLARENSPMAPLELAAALHLTPAAVTHLAKHLASQGLLETAINGTDKRARLISLSAAGRAAHRAAMLALSDLTTRLLVRFSGPDLEIANRNLGRFADWLENPDNRK